MAAAVGIYMINRLIQVIDDFDGGDQGEEFGIKVFRAGRPGGGVIFQNGEGPRFAAKLNFMLSPGVGDAG